MRLHFELDTLDDTTALGCALAGLLRAGDILALQGDLGAGKTTLARAIAQARGVDPSLISSPTYVIVNEYPPAQKGEPPVVHVDAYRLTSAEDLDPLGWDRLADGTAVLLIEWAERIAEALPPERTATLHLRATAEHSRAAELDCPEAWESRSLFAALRQLALPPRTPTTCPVTGQHVPPDSPSWPFASDRARMADLYKWFSGQHEISRPMDERDLDEVE
ncbi:MAG: tRNA (adenosine(37)-N6)-threonylcarbamoyltransferase complex ATPase subunit type 1 TsaE [Planctomycetota bacterium]|nr:tRNA (adenosine(37)-N6)-threonylcarbamoyltransferase complex ATPase subunit type 1 TsaE [Planctomycetota bacterium]